MGFLLGFMKKTIQGIGVLGILWLGYVAHAHDMASLLSNPHTLQKTWEQCEAKTQNVNGCQKITRYYKLGIRALKYAENNPQNFGLKILKLQEQLATHAQKLPLLKKAHAPRSEILKIKRVIQKDREHVAVYLSVIRWLESPE